MTANAPELDRALSEAEQSWIDAEETASVRGARSVEAREAFSPRVFSLRDLQQHPELLAPPQQVVPHIAWQGHLVMLAGREKSGKSTLARAGAAALSCGRAFLGAPTVQGRVLYCALEESAGSVVRSLTEYDANPDDVLIVSELSDKNGERIDFLRETIEDDDISLVVMDTLLAYAPEVEDANSAAKMQGVVLPLAHLAHDTGAAILMLHHAKKSNGGYRDSSAIGGAVDAILEMREPEGNENDTLRIVKGRGRFDVQDFRFRYVNGKHMLVVADTEAASAEARAYEFILSNPDASLRQIRGAVGVRAEVVDRALGALERAGRVVNLGSAKKRKYRIPFDVQGALLVD